MSPFKPTDLLLVGLSHRFSPVSVREFCSVAPEDLARRLGELRESKHEGESWLLSTCNRTEVLVTTSDADEAERLVRKHFFDGLPEGGESQVYQHRGIEAVFHLFRVASGLESQVLGESEILGQVKRATDLSREAEMCGPALAPLLRQMLEVGKRVRRDTKLGEGTLSVARAAVDLAGKVFGSFSRVKALIVGAGETGQLVARHLKVGGIEKLTFANRTQERAQKAASEFDGDVLAFDDLRAGISAANLVIVSVDAPEPVVKPEHIDASRMRGRDRPTVMVDLSVPRAIHPDVRLSRSGLVQDLDSLDRIVQRHRGERQKEIDAADRILIHEVHKFLSLRAYDTFKPVISGLGDAFEQARSEVMGSHRSQESLESFSRKLAKRLLDVAFGQLKQGTRLAHTTDAVSDEYQKFLERR
jgi:glutamyl-tRNA reductase